MHWTRTRPVLDVLWISKDDESMESEVDVVGICGSEMSRYVSCSVCMHASQTKKAYTGVARELVSISISISVAFSCAFWFLNSVWRDGRLVGVCIHRYNGFVYQYEINGIHTSCAELRCDSR